MTTHAGKVPPSDELRLFHEVAQALTSNLELEPLLRAILGKMEEYFGPERWSLLMVDEETGELHYALTTGKSSVPSGTKLRRGEGIAGWVALTGEPLVIPDVRLDRDWSRFAREHPELNLHSIACLPLRHGGRTLGVLQLHNSKLELMPGSSLSFLRVLCDYAAIALENARQVNLVHRLSITDDCTGLFNARYLYSMLETAITSAIKPALVPKTNHFSLLFFDLDRFKSINDTYGHLVGSRLLAEAGSLIKRTLGPQHAAFRYGGDEFVALLHGLDKEEATEAASFLRERLRETELLTGEGLALKITASFGLATFPQDGRDLHSIIRAADTMMYCAKAEGRDCLVVASEERSIDMPTPKNSRHN
ncbi:MAG TPA: sensor domain-containing diguanylate cyclase [Acidobacteriaceae bacterium]|nr:sensor domain-containing diguanylate cyclase [Acidobacteriaceae bacterium]